MNEGSKGSWSVRRIHESLDAHSVIARSRVHFSPRRFGKAEEDRRQIGPGARRCMSIGFSCAGRLSAQCPTTIDISYCSVVRCRSRHPRKPDRRDTELHSHMRSVAQPWQTSLHQSLRIVNCQSRAPATETLSAARELFVGEINE